MKSNIVTLFLFSTVFSCHARMLGGGGHGGNHNGGNNNGGNNNGGNNNGGNNNGGNDNGGGGGGFSANPPGQYCQASSSCSNPALYVKPLPIPDIIDGQNGGTAIITSSKGCQQVFHNTDGTACGSPTEVWGYEGSWPGPTVVVKKGQSFNIKHVNNLGKDYDDHDISVSIHHHGLHIEPAFDGHPRADKVFDSSFGIDPAAFIKPNKDFTYEIPNDQEPGTHWYHDHTMHDTGRNVVMGLAGFYLITPNDEAQYKRVRSSRIPSGEYEIGLAIQDRSFTSTNQFDYPMTHDELIDSGLVHGGYFGDTMLVNGMHAPYLDVKQGMYRFRVLNGCNARQIQIEVQNGNQRQGDIMYQIGTEGGHIKKPKLRSSIYIAPGERYDILIDFRSYSIGSRLYLRNTYDQYPLLPNILEFRVVGGRPPSASRRDPPKSLVSYSFPENPSKTRNIDLVRPGGMGGGGGAWTIGNQMYDPDAANLQVRRGDTERWSFSAHMSQHPHPMHLHLVQFRIEGVGSGELEDGWKDIVMVPSNGQRSIVATFDGEPGIYMFHCHNLEHEDWDMMLQYEICDDSNDHPCNLSLLNAFTGGGMGGHRLLRGTEANSAPAIRDWSHHHIDLHNETSKIE